MPSLFDPIQLGAIAAPNRILMAPLTRGRASADHVPTPIMAEYYAQRASAGLIISEATGISREGLGWPYAPGIWNDAQRRAWTPVVAAVHQAGGRILCQLWHMGRLVHPDFLEGAAPVSSSATIAPGRAHTYAGKQPYGMARALQTGEIARLLADYRTAAALAMDAGFDGVQIHAANGYLIDQFLRDNSNHRDDDYGGDVACRVRLLREVTQAVAETVGPGRTAVRLSPNEAIQGVDDSDPAALFTAAARVLGEIGIAFLELREPGEHGTFGRAAHPAVAPAIKAAFGGPLVLNSDYDGTRGQAALDSNVADAIAFGRPFLANPDLPARIRTGATLNPDVMATWYSQGPEGYTDYAKLNAA
ncbi:alkene reductase [Lichenicoccus sp.]|uniref:alkene reductase n=1 Tax=Lichenicoccus sp. TaxID=2781899 RepID=UPI003D14AAB0